jgi:hypothetical protein
MLELGAECLDGFCSPRFNDQTHLNYARHERRLPINFWSEVLKRRNEQLTTIMEGRPYENA